MIVLQRARHSAVKQGGTADIIRPWLRKPQPGTFFIYSYRPVAIEGYARIDAGRIHSMSDADKNRVRDIRSKAYSRVRSRAYSKVHSRAESTGTERSSEAMKIIPAPDQIRPYIGDYGTYPLSAEILSDMRTPIEVLRVLQNISGHVYLLESVSGHENWGRYTFLGYDPKLEINCSDGLLKAGSLQIRTDDPVRQNECGITSF